MPQRNRSLMWEQRLKLASERFWFSFWWVIQQKTESEYFKTLPLSVSLDSFWFLQRDSDPPLCFSGQFV